MTKKIKALRTMTVPAFPVEGTASVGAAEVRLTEGETYDLTEAAQLLMPPQKYILHLSQGPVELFEGADFVFV